MNYLGDFPVGGVVDFKWSSNAANGSSITRATNGTVAVYFGNDAGQITDGLTDTEDFDSVTGIHHCRIDLTQSSDYAAGVEYQVVLSGATIDGQTVNAVLAHFSIERAGGVLALLKGANGLSAIKTETASIQSDTNDIQSRLPAALVSGRMDASVGAMAANVMTAAAAAADLTTEFQSGLATSAAVATIDGKVDTIDGVVDAILADTAEIGSAGAGLTALASAADLATVAGYLDTEIAAILADTNELQTDWADGGRLDLILDARALQASVDTIDTVVDAIKVTTDKLDETLVNSSDGYIFTAAALQDAPTGGSAPTASQIADEVQTRTIAAVATVNGLAANVITAAATAADFGSEVAAAVWADATRTLTALDEDTTTIDLDSTIRSAVGLGAANLDTQLAAIDDAVDTEVAAIKAVTDKIDNTLENTSDGWIFTVNSLQNAPPGGPSAADIADAVWEEAIADHSGTAGSTAEALAAAGSAGDPWITALPGAYSAGQAGKIVGDFLNASVSSRATQTSVDDLPTNAELATALDPLPTAAENATAVWAAGSRTLTAIDEDSTTLDLDATIRAAVGLGSANLDTQIGDIPTNAELATALGTADDAVLAAIASLPTAVQNADTLLNRDMSAGTDSGSTTVRTPRQALRILRNKWSIDSDGLQTITKEDDATPSWTQQLSTDAAAQPVTGTDPAGP